MPGDYTRFTFAPGEDHIGVLMQQGRVLLDADFNELVEILERRIRIGTLDTFNRCVVPRTTPDGFQIGFSGGMLTIGRGRIYLDGILAENHGGQPDPPAPFDPVTTEMVGTTPVRFDEQPYLPDPPALPQGGGPHLVYVDVWQREITYLEEPDLLEKAVGVDSATRLQTIWQVKVLDNVGPGVTCATPADQIPDWVALNAPPAGRLTVRAVGVPAETDPCIVSPSGGYRGTENRLYRVEVHDGGAPGTATFKWSRDNASIATAVLGMNAARTRLTVARTARDAVLRFSPDDWVEVLDDELELAGQPGVLRKVALVDDVSGLIELAAALPAGAFDPTDAERHTRLRRWDQQGLVRNEANVVVADVDASGGVIPVLAAGNLVLEDGIRVEFTVSPAGGLFRTGDFWVFAARTVDASVEELTQAPPRGIHHHYCRLAVYTAAAGDAGGQVSDCRVFWPPECECEGGGCDCTVCVSAEEHNSGTFTIQMAVDQVTGGEGGKVCLGPGVYLLTEPVRIANAQSIQLEGRGWRSILFFLAREGPSGAAIEVVNSIGVDITALAVFALGIGGGEAMAIHAQNVAAVSVERCLLVQFGTGDRGGAAVGLSGFLIQTVIRNNLIFGTLGIATLSRFRAFGGDLLTLEAAAAFTLTLGLHLEENQILGVQGGVVLAGATFHVGDTDVSGNSIYFSRAAGILAEGLVAPWARLDIGRNEVVAAGAGIVVGTDNTRVTWNDVGELPGRGDASRADGIILAEPLDDGEIDGAQVIGNRVTRMSGAGIRLTGRVRSAMIKQNVIRQTGAGGIVMDDESAAGILTIENNQLLDIDVPDEERAQAGIRLVRVRQGEVVHNTLIGLAPQSFSSPLLSGIEASFCESLRLAGNQLAEIGPAGEFPRVVVGIAARGDFDDLEVSDNRVHRSLATPGDIDPSLWLALWLGIGTTLPQGFEAAIGEIPVLTSSPFGSDVIFLAEAELGVRREALFGSRLVAVLPGRRLAGVRGNVLEARGRAPAVLVSAGRNCHFGDNRCLYLPAAVDRPAAAAFIGASTVIASSNYVERRVEDRELPAFEIFSDPERFTVLGNVVSSGLIRVNGSPLGAPWAPLNVIS